MWIKNKNNMWEEQINLLDEPLLEPYLDKLKTYSKGLKAAGYTITNTLEDVYSVINKQHSYWLVNTSASDIILNNVNISAGVLYNLSDMFTQTEIKALYDVLNNHISKNRIKASNANLFNINGCFDWFLDFNPSTDLVPAEYADAVLKYNYSDTDWTDVFRSSIQNEGYTIPNVFTSDAVYTTLLKNFYVADIAADTHIDLINQLGSVNLYPLLNIDGITLQDGSVVLLTKQNNAVDNGIYIYQDNYLKLLDKWRDSKDNAYTIVYIKNGNKYSYKEFTLAEKVNGSYPVLNEEKYFVEKENIILRNETSYRTAAQHTFKDILVSSALGKEAVKRFSREALLPDNTRVYVSDNDLLVFVKEEISTIFSFPENTSDSLTLIKKVIYNSLLNTISVVYKNNTNSLVKLLEYNLDSKTSTTHILLGEVIDFCLISNKFYYTTNIELSYHIKELNQTNFNSLDVYANDLLINNISGVEYAGRPLIIFNEHNTLKFYYNGIVQFIKNASNISSLNTVLENGTIKLSFISDNEPFGYQIKASEALDMSAWAKGDKHKIEISGKKNIEDWSVKNNILFKADLPVTGLQLKNHALAPKLTNDVGRYFDGVDDSVEYSGAIVSSLSSTNAFSVQVTVTPSSILPNSPIFYIGEKVEQIPASLLQELPAAYISLFVSDEKGLPYVIVKSGNKEQIVKGTSKVALNKKVDFTISWEQTNDKTILRLFSGNKLIGDSTDIRTVINPIIDISTIPYDVVYLAKSENATLPLFNGVIENFRIWDKSLNTAQILARQNVLISKNDVIFSNLLINSYLRDTNSEIKNVISSSVSNNGIFTGNIAVDPLYSSLNNAFMIQKDNNYLYLLDKQIGRSRIFSIDIKKENIIELINTSDDIVSICLDSNSLYYYSSNTLYEYDLLTKANKIVSTYGVGVIDFTVSNGNVFLYRANNNLYDDSENVLYTNTQGFNCLYSAKEGARTLLYIKTLADTDVVLISNLNTPGFHFLGVYPFETKLSLNVGSYLVKIKDNTLQFNNKIVETPWSNKATICRVVENDLSSFITMVIESEQIQAWLYNITDNTFIRMDSDDMLGYTSQLNIDAVLYENSNNKYLAVLNNEQKTIIWSKIEYNNKLSWASLPWVFKWDNDKDLSTYSYIAYENNSLSLLSTEDGTTYFSSLKNDSIVNYADWEQVDLISDSVDNSVYVVGDYGVLLKEQNSVIESQSLLRRYEINSSALDVLTDKIWSVGDYGKVLYSVFGGEEDIVKVSTQHDLLDISIYKNNIFISGKHNTLLYSNSNGKSFVVIDIPEEVGIHDWYAVHAYADDKIMLAGTSGSLLFLTKNKNIWESVKIKNQDSNLLPLLIYDKKGKQQDVYFKTIRKVISLPKENDFVLIGDGDFISVLSVSNDTDSILVKQVFYETLTNQDWKKAQYFYDNVINQHSLMLVSSNAVYSVSIGDYKIIEPNYRKLTQVKLIIDSDNVLYDAYYNKYNNIVYAVGDRVNWCSKPLFEIPLNNKMPFLHSDKSVEYKETYKFFKPRHIFLDYFIGRKSNIHSKDNKWIVPTGSVDKNVLDCFRFNNNDYFELSGRSVSGQPNYMSYLDLYYLNRRSLSATDRNGSMEKWQEFNKKIVAVSNLTYKQNFVSVLNISSLQNSSNSGYIKTEKISTNQNLSATHPVENSFSTKIVLQSTSFSINDNDVFEAVFYKDTNAVSPKIGDKLMLRVVDQSATPMFNIEDTAIVEDGDIVRFKEFSFYGWVASGKTLADLEQEVLIGCKSFYDISLRARCIQPPTQLDLKIEIRVVSAHKLGIAKQLFIDGGNKHIMLADVWNEDMVYELNNIVNGKIRLRNLNYFNGDIQHLKHVFADHIFGQNYDIDISKKDNIIVTGKIDNHNTYYNLDTKVNLSVNNVVHSYSVVYDELDVYTPDYSLYKLLNLANSTIFTKSYAFSNMPDYSQNIRTSYKDANGKFTEVSFSNNRIYMGEDALGATEFVENTFIDITTNLGTVSQARIKSIIKSEYSKAPGHYRYILHTDKDLQHQLVGSTGLIRIRMRNLLSEISLDLDATDNINFPVIIKADMTFEMNKSYFNQIITGGAYAPFLLNDDNIRRYITSISYNDNNGNWKTNIINWKKDVNLIYRPTDYYHIGSDSDLTKPILLDQYNYNLSQDGFGLKDVDESKYTFILVDGMTVKKLEQNYHWILNATLRDSIIGEDEDGLVFYRGEWVDGLFEGGKFYSGIIRNIEWISGTMYSFPVNYKANLVTVDKTVVDNNSYSLWYSGNWYSGTWNAGTWYQGVWSDGVYNSGLWINGVHENGVWRNGRFDGGEWLNGTWLNGQFSQNNSYSVWHNGNWFGGDFENGLWLNGTWDETDRVSSRFGVKASYLKNAIWEYGTWKNGSFYSGTKAVDISGKSVLLPSGNYNNSRWLNGTWQKGTFYGGSWDFGTWYNGIWVNGYMRSSLTIDIIEVRDAGSLVVRFNQKHYFKDTLNAYFTIVGKPIFNKGELDERTKFLGYNAYPIKHKVSEIVDDYTVIIACDDSFAAQYVSNIGITTVAQQLLQRCALNNCLDYTIIPVNDIRTVKVEPNTLPYNGLPKPATHWLNGTWQAGIWEFGYFENGLFKSGMWVDGVFEQGTFGK